MGGGHGESLRGLGRAGDQQPQHFEGLEQLPCSDPAENKQLRLTRLPTHPLPQLCPRPLCYHVRSAHLPGTREFLLTQWLRATLAKVMNLLA